MWSTIIYSYTFILLWIFDFVTLCTAALLMIAHNTQLNELKKCILSKNVHVESSSLTEIGDNIDSKLGRFTQEVADKLRMSPCEIQRAEKALSKIEAKTFCRRDRYKSLMTELKKDVSETKQEVKLLQNQVYNLTFRREALKSEVLKQQEDYQRLLDNLTKALEYKEIMSFPNLERIRAPYKSCFSFRTKIL